ncbi:MAG: AAA family ATPase [Byssovorax sp.]
MYRKDVNERSPMRVFEKSTHGGLGRGNVGVVASRPGVGKTPLLVQIALDDLLRDRKVLHISHEHAVDHVRAYYDEIFHDLSVTSKLSDTEAVKLDVERHRLIYSLLSQASSQPLSARGGRSSLGKILETVRFARDIAHFEPDVIIIDGFDFHHATEDAVQELKGLAVEANVELWLSVHSEAPTSTPGHAGTLPAPLDRFGKHIGVVVFLASERDVVRLRLLKDHDNEDLADLHLRLDSHTMRIVDEDVLPQSERPKNPRRFRLLSGGSRGAEAEFGACAEKWGMAEVHYSFEGHRYMERTRGVVNLSENELKKGDFSLMYVSKRLNRVLSEIPQVRSVLQTIWHQINNASQVFVIGAIQADNTVRGGTGWGAELARLWKKPLFVFDQTKRSWFKWSGSAWEIATLPVITSEAFAGIGTQNLTPEGKEAINDLFLRSFGAPST